MLAALHRAISLLVIVHDLGSTTTSANLPKGAVHKGAVAQHNRVLAAKRALAGEGTSGDEREEKMAVRPRSGGRLRRGR